MRTKSIVFPLAVATSVLLGTAAASLIPITIVVHGTSPSTTVPPVEVLPKDYDIEPNDVCQSGAKWPVASAAVSGGGMGIGRGAAGAFDPEDWSSVEVYRTEEIQAWAEGPVTLGMKTPDCRQPLVPAADIAGVSGDFQLQVVGKNSAASDYAIHFSILPKDINGNDVPDVSGAAWEIAATPAAVVDIPYVSGSLPNRPNEKTDIDWYAVNIPSLTPAGTEGLSASLTSITLSTDCNGGQYGLRLYEATGQTRIKSQDGCQAVVSCIAVGPSRVLAEALVISGRGTGYDLTASTLPLRVIGVYPSNIVTFLQDNDSPPIAVGLNPSDPWCDASAPVLLSLLSTVTGLLQSPGTVNLEESTLEKAGALKTHVESYLP